MAEDEIVDVITDMLGGSAGGVVGRRRNILAKSLEHTRELFRLIRSGVGDDETADKLRELLYALWKQLTPEEEEELRRFYIAAAPPPARRLEVESISGATEVLDSADAYVEAHEEAAKEYETFRFPAEGDFERFLRYFGEGRWLGTIETKGGLYLVPNKAPAGFEALYANPCRALHVRTPPLTEGNFDTCFVESDELSIAEQMTRLLALDPKPTAIVATGDPRYGTSGRSLHALWKLKTPIDFGLWLEIQLGLIGLVEGDLAALHPLSLVRVPDFQEIGRDRAQTLVYWTPKNDDISTLVDENVDALALRDALKSHVEKGLDVVQNVTLNYEPSRGADDGQVLALLNAYATPETPVIDWRGLEITDRQTALKTDERWEDLRAHFLGAWE